MKNLSPKYWVHKIKQKVFIFHGANDSIVPFTESIQLAEYIPNAELLISYLYTHKEIVKDTSSYFLLKEVLFLKTDISYFILAELDKRQDFYYQMMRI